MERAAITAVFALLGVAMWPAFLNGSVFWTDSRKWVVGAEGFFLRKDSRAGPCGYDNENGIESPAERCSAWTGGDARPCIGGGLPGSIAFEQGVSLVNQSAHVGRFGQDRPAAGCGSLLFDDTVHMDRVHEEGHVRHGFAEHAGGLKPV